MNYLPIIIVVQFLYLLYQDHANRKERQRLEILLKSENATEYKTVVTKLPKPEKGKDEEPSPYVPIEEVPVETLIDKSPTERL